MADILHGAEGAEFFFNSTISNNICTTAGIRYAFSNLDDIKYGIVGVE